jgi:hypothetical protein
LYDIDVILGILYNIKCDSWDTVQYQMWFLGYCTISFETNLVQKINTKPIYCWEYYWWKYKKIEVCLKTIQYVKRVDILGHYHCCGMSKVKSGSKIEKHVFN